MRDWRGRIGQDISDKELMETLLSDDNIGSLTDDQIEMFVDIRENLRRWGRLTDKQRAVARDVLDKLLPQYENLVSSGVVSAESKVETIPLLKRENLPLKPPPRRPKE